MRNAERFYEDDMNCFVVLTVSYRIMGSKSALAPEGLNSVEGDLRIPGAMPQAMC